MVTDHLTERMGSVLNLPIKQTVSIGTMLNFDGAGHGHGDDDGTCKQAFTPCIDRRGRSSDTEQVDCFGSSERKRKMEQDLTKQVDNFINSLRKILVQYNLCLRSFDHVVIFYSRYSFVRSPYFYGHIFFVHRMTRVVYTCNSPPVSYIISLRYCTNLFVIKNIW